ncbi:MAG: rfbD [Herminiimonas sp.]|nr:rfbD [Herminiimonas sp.]
MKKMRILLTGKSGQVGYELERSLQPCGEVIALDRKGMDLADLARVRDVIRSVKPDLIINPAAYTAVDKAETEPDLAMRINGEAPGVMAEEARKIGAAMIHYSTDYVFDGSKATPYTEDDPTCPINVYGSSKLAGEQAIRAADIPHLILRTSWVYGLRGKNFLLTIMRLAQERDELRIVSDQHGAPTWCRTIADATAAIVTQTVSAEDTEAWWRLHSGLYHLTAQGRTTWYGFAKAVLEHPSVTSTSAVIPIESSEYPVPARRPANSVMSGKRLMKTFCELPTWDSALKLCQDR